MKAGSRSNNRDPNACQCMASAAVGCMQVFGIGEPANIYDDIELADTLVPCGATPAEAHPLLWSRITDRAAQAFRALRSRTLPRVKDLLSEYSIQSPSISVRLPFR